MTNIFVGNLAYHTTDSDLHQTFGAFGSVERANVVRDRDSGQSRGFGFVEMTNPAEAAQAVTGLDGKDLNGRILKVNEARPREYSGGSQNRGGSGYNRNSRSDGGPRESRW